MPSGPAFGVKPCMRPRLGPERQDHSARRFGLATPCAASRRGWSRMLVQPLDDARLRRYDPCLMTAECARAIFHRSGRIGGPRLRVSPGDRLLPRGHGGQERRGSRSVQRAGSAGHPPAQPCADQGEIVKEIAGGAHISASAPGGTAPLSRASGIGPIGLIRDGRRRAVGPIRPMSPMPHGVHWLGLGERVGGGGPLAGRFLPGEDEAGGVSAGEP